MSNRSLLFFVAVSIATHTAALEYLPDVEYPLPRQQQCSVEVGLVALPQFKKDFTRNHNRSSQTVLADKNNKETQKLAVNEPPPSATATLSNNEIQSRQKKGISSLTKAISECITANSTLPTKSTRSPQTNKSPAMATKAAPLYSKNPAPTYPANALRYGWEGEVWLKVIVSRNGTVGDIIIEQSSDYQVLDQAAVKTVWNWQFEPARIDNKTTEGFVHIPIRFRIKRS